MEPGGSSAAQKFWWGFFFFILLFLIRLCCFRRMDDGIWSFGLLLPIFFGSSVLELLARVIFSSLFWHFCADCENLRMHGGGDDMQARNNLWWERRTAGVVGPCVIKDFAALILGRGPKNTTQSFLGVLSEPQNSSTALQNRFRASCTVQCVFLGCFFLVLSC